LEIRNDNAAKKTEKIIDNAEIAVP